MVGGPFKTAEAVAFVRGVEKFVRRGPGPGSWIDQLVDGMRRRTNPSRLEARIDILCPELPNDDHGLGGRFIIDAWSEPSRSRPQRCSARLAYVDEDERHWNVVRCNGSAGHGGHRNRVTGVQIFSGETVVPHAHYLTMATLESIEAGEDTDPDNYAVPGGSWDTVWWAVHAVAKRGNIREHPATLVDPADRPKRTLP